MPQDGHRTDLYDLVDACRDGDQSGWAQLIAEFSPLVYSIPRGSGFTQEESEDIVQTVFALLVRKLGSLEDPQALPKWLSVTTQRACWREIRSGRARRTREAAAGESSPYKEIESIAEAEDQAEALRMALQEVGERCERLLRALFLTGRRRSPVYEEVSEATGMPVGSIGPTRARCLKRLSHSLCDFPAGQDLLRRFGADLPDHQGN